MKEIDRVAVEIELFGVSDIFVIVVLYNTNWNANNV